jgi:hypothetical protein
LLLLQQVVDRREQCDSASSATNAVIWIEKLCATKTTLVQAHRHTPHLMQKRRNKYAQDPVYNHRQHVGACSGSYSCFELRASSGMSLGAGFFNIRGCMPFFDDTGVDTSQRHGPLLATLNSLRDQPERLIAANLAWSAQLLPGIMALAFAEWPGWLRLALGAYSAIVLVPATGVLYAVAARAAAHEQLTMETVLDLLRGLALPSLRAFAPLFAGCGLLVWLTIVVSAVDLFALDVLLRLILLCVAFCAIYWGPLFAADPTQTAQALASQSFRFAWHVPVPTFMTAGALLVTLIVGAISVGGLFLIVPITVALLQVHLLRHVSHREQ